jgi:hypothetical protein
MQGHKFSLHFQSEQFCSQFSWESIQARGDEGQKGATITTTATSPMPPSFVQDAVLTLAVAPTSSTQSEFLPPPPLAA